MSRAASGPAAIAVHTHIESLNAAGAELHAGIGGDVRQISESTAKAFFPGQDPIGKRFKAASFNANQPNLSGAWRTVIGVVGNVRYKGLHEVQLDMYDPPSQTTVGMTTSLVVRLKAGEERNALGVAAAIQTQAPG